MQTDAVLISHLKSKTMVPKAGSQAMQGLLQGSAKLKSHFTVPKKHLWGIKEINCSYPSYTHELCLFLEEKWKEGSSRTQ